MTNWKSKNKKITWEIILAQVLFLTVSTSQKSEIWQPQVKKCIKFSLKATGAAV